MKLLKKLLVDNRGQNTVEVMVLIATLVFALAAATHVLLPHLALGFRGMSVAVSAPTP